MTGKRNWLLIILLVGLTACNLPAFDESSSETEPVPVPTVTNTVPAPIDEPTQGSTSSCDPGQILDLVRAEMPVNEYAVHYNVSRGMATLVIWSVNSEIELLATQAQISENLDEAWVHAGRMAMAAVNASRCVSELFDAVDTIVVDRDYNGWLSGQFPTASIPYGASFEESEAVALQVLDSMEASYVRQAPPQPVPEGTCDWPQARQNIWGHFSPERRNIAFYYTIDEYGGNVWAQWDGPPDDAMLIASLANVMLGLECFNPEANIIAMVVDQNGNMIKIGVVPEMNMAEMEIVEP